MRGRPILVAAEGATLPSNTFTMPAALKEKGWILQKTDTTLNLAHIPGMMFILR